MNKEPIVPTTTTTEDGKTIFWYTIQQIEEWKHRKLMSKIDEMFKRKHENHTH